MRTSFYLWLSSLILIPLGTALAQDKAPDRIEDNSFLIEEAYNQEDGVVQHINFFEWDHKTEEWQYTFTQEWPFLGQANQLSYTVPFSRVDEDGAKTGIGDLLLNYRRQVVLDERVAFAPRLSVSLPTGYYKDGLGADAVGFQANLPLSVVLSDKFVMHWNLGTTVVPDNRAPSGMRSSTTGFNYGTSFIYLLKPSWNLMLELVGTHDEIPGTDAPSSEDTMVINPGTRFAIDFDSGLQIVPGIAFPIGVGPSEGDWGVISYISFEHPF